MTLFRFINISFKWCSPLLIILPTLLSAKIPQKQKDTLIEIAHQYSDGFADFDENSIRYKELQKSNNGNFLSISSFTLENFCMGNNHWFEFIVVFEQTCPGERKAGRNYSSVAGVCPVYCPSDYGYYDVSKAQFDQENRVIKIPSTNEDHELRLIQRFRFWMIDPTSIAQVSN